MTKFVYMMYGSAYEEYILNALRNENNVFIFQPFKNKLIQKLHVLHNSRLLNKRQELPFKRIWFSRIMKGIDVDSTDDIYFIFYESFHLSYSQKFLSYLKMKYPKCRICFVYLNPVTKIISDKIIKVRHCYNAVITFNEKDASQYNLLYVPIMPYRLPHFTDKNLEKSDCFFVGLEKGRLNKLLKIYEKLTDAGLKCDFHIVGVPENKQKYKDKIIYNKTMSYTEVLQHVDATNCVLEILQNEEDYISIRTYEALQYHRKLLTESKSIKKFSFYNSKIVQVFEDINDINTDFFRQEISQTDFSSSLPGSPIIFHEFLVNNILYNNSAKKT